MKYLGWMFLAVFQISPDSVAKSAVSLDSPSNELRCNRRWEILPPPQKPVTMESYRSLWQRAGELMGDWSVHVAGIDFDGPLLANLASTAADEPFLRVVREGLRRPIDLEDFTLFLDDLLYAGSKGLAGNAVWVTSGRARNSGITVHPNDVFKVNQPVLYGKGECQLSIALPKRPSNVKRARDWEILGPRWTARYPNPPSTQKMLDELNRKNRNGDYGTRIRSLRRQIREQGGEFYVYATVRNRGRGYLMWGAFALAKKKSRNAVRSLIRRLNRRNREWGLNIPIRWKHPGGWRETVQAALEMAETYDVVYATEMGARESNHYGGQAADFVGLALPRTLHLTAPDGKKEVFDLSGPEETRDLNLSPQLIEWVETNFRLSKLKSDYPHWDDPIPMNSP